MPRDHGKNRATKNNLDLNLPKQCKNKEQENVNIGAHSTDQHPVLENATNTEEAEVTIDLTGDDEEMPLPNASQQPKSKAQRGRSNRITSVSEILRAALAGEENKRCQSQSEVKVTLDLQPEPSKITTKSQAQPTCIVTQTNPLVDRNNLLTRNSPALFNFGGRLQQFPRTTATDNVRINTQPFQALPMPVDQTRGYLNRNNSRTQERKHQHEHRSNSTTFHQHFLDHPSEQNVLGAIFVNNLLRQSLSEYQNFRSTAFPHPLHQRMQMRPGTQITSISQPITIPVGFCKDSCHSRRNQKQAETAINIPRSAMTKSVTSTFTSPSTSSVSTKAQGEDFRSLTTNTREHGHAVGANNILTGYRTVEMQSNIAPFTYRRNRDVAAKLCQQPTSKNNEVVHRNVRIAAMQPQLDENATRPSQSSLPVNFNVSSSPKPKQKQQQLAGANTTITISQEKNNVKPSSSTRNTSKNLENVRIPIHRLPLVGFPEAVAEAIHKHHTASNGQPTSSMASTQPGSISRANSMPGSAAGSCRPITPSSGNVYIPSGTWQFTFKTNNHANNKSLKRVVTFADLPEQIYEAKSRKCQHHYRRLGSHSRRAIEPRRTLRSAMRSTMKNASEHSLSSHRRLAPASTKQASSGVISTCTTTSTVSTAPTIPCTTMAMEADQTSALSNTASPPPATVTLQHACRFYRCQSVTHPNAVLGMIRTCRMCHSNYTIACGNIAGGRCAINLSDVECPKCWNSNACYCGQPFSDRYIGGREI